MKDQKLKVHPVFNPAGNVEQEGMSLRDYFAAKAMQAMVARDNPSAGWGDSGQAYEIADAMLKARE